MGAEKNNLYRVVTILGVILMFVSFKCFSPELVYAQSVKRVVLNYFNEKREALLGENSAGGRRVAIIYNHGFIVEKVGYEEAKKAGYDVGEFVAAFAQAGFLVLAPLRHMGDRMDILMREAIRFLKSQSKNKIAGIYVVGYSQGGAETLRVLPKFPQVKKIVLMSPALKVIPESDTLKGIKGEMLITLGAYESRGFRNRILNGLVPLLRAGGVRVNIKSQYKGDHRWFWRVRRSYFSDILEFLADKNPKETRG